MLCITPVTDRDLLFEIEFPENIIQVESTEILMIWDDCDREKPLPVRYELFRSALNQKWGVQVSKGTAYLVLEAALKLVTEVKKNCLLLPNLKSLVSKPQDEAEQS